MFISHAEQRHILLPLHLCTVIQFYWSTTNHDNRQLWIRCWQK